jgi:CheY-like chemotaxis protein
MARILVVDDTPISVQLMNLTLTKQGHEVRSADNGAQGVAATKEWCPDLVIMDVMMPEMDGYEAMRRIRQLPRFKGLPIIALTAKAMKGDREKCIEAGASDYVTKPVDADQLVSLLRVWLYR